MTPVAPKLWKWNYEETGEFFMYHGSRHDEPPTCPICGKTAHYWEGQIDQDRMGNDIDGCGYICWTCRVGTEAEELP